MNDDVRALIQAIHDSPPRAVFATAGAGSQALADLLAVAGASRTLLEARVPYSAASFDDFLGSTPAQYVAEATACRMAGRALARAQALQAEPPLIGLACTATIATDRPKRGDHRAHVAAWTAPRLIRYSVTLDKGARDRAGEEDVVSRLILNVLAEACGLPGRLVMDTMPDDAFDSAVHEFETQAEQLAAETVPMFGIDADGSTLSRNAHPPAILSGSFNPLHSGHTGLAETGAGILGQPVAFELTAVNADKPRLPTPVLLQRLSQFAGTYTVFASNAPTFVEKARLYPGTTFVVGYDTAARIIQPRYYGDSEAGMLAALAEIRAQGCRFLVAGREGDDGVFRTLTDLALPDGTADLFRAIPERQFRNDISSTEIRAGL